MPASFAAVASDKPSSCTAALNAARTAPSSSGPASLSSKSSVVLLMIRVLWLRRRGSVAVLVMVHHVQMRAAWPGSAHLCECAEQRVFSVLLCVCVVDRLQGRRATHQAHDFGSRQRCGFVAFG